MPNEEEIKVKARRDAFASIAIWQILAFVFLLCFVWANELLDFPALVFGLKHTPFNLYRASFLSAAVIAAGIVATGHTYEQQRSILRRLLKTCMYCHRVQTPNGEWQHVEEYFIQHYPVAMDRGACPACEKMLADVQEKDEATRADKPARG